MINGKKVVVVMPAYRAARTVERTWRALPHAIVDHVLLSTTQAVTRRRRWPRPWASRSTSTPRTAATAATRRPATRRPLRRGADIVVMVHPDYQYDPRLVTAMAAMIDIGIYDVVLGSRILGRHGPGGRHAALEVRRQPLLTAFQNLLIGAKLSEYHTGYRAFSRQVLRDAAARGELRRLRVRQPDARPGHRASASRIGEISCPTRYEPDSSSIGLRAPSATDSACWGRRSISSCGGRAWPAPNSWISMPMRYLGSSTRTDGGKPRVSP